MNRRRWKIWAALLFAGLALLAVLYWGRADAASSSARPGFAKPSADAPAAVAAAPLPAVSPEGRLVLEDGGQERAFTIARDEFVLRSPEGVEKPIAISPVGDLRGLRDQWTTLSREGGGELFLVAYEEGVARSLATRRLVLPQIRVELEEGVALSGAIPNAIQVDHPEYAPGFAVVKLRDGFAALDALKTAAETGRGGLGTIFLVGGRRRPAAPAESKSRLARRAGNFS